MGWRFVQTNEKQVEPIVTGLYDKEEGDDSSIAVRFESEPCLGSGLDRALVVVMRIEDTVGVGCDEIIYDLAARSCWRWGPIVAGSYIGFVVMVFCMVGGFTVVLQVCPHSAIWHCCQEYICLFIARKSRNARSDSNSKVPSEDELEDDRGSNGGIWKKVMGGTPRHDRDHTVNPTNHPF